MEQQPQRSELIERNKSSITMTFRKDKEGNIKVTGFDVKSYGDNAVDIGKLLRELEAVGKERLEEASQPSSGDL